MQSLSPQSSALSAFRSRKRWIVLLTVNLYAPVLLLSFTGLNNDYEPPTDCELKIDISIRSGAEATNEIERMLAETGELVDLAANI